MEPARVGLPAGRRPPPAAASATSRRSRNASRPCCRPARGRAAAARPGTLGHGRAPGPARLEAPRRGRREALRRRVVARSRCRGAGRGGRRRRRRGGGAPAPAPGGRRRGRRRDRRACCVPRRRGCPEHLGARGAGRAALCREAPPHAPRPGRHAGRRPRPGGGASSRPCGPRWSASRARSGSSGVPGSRSRTTTAHWSAARSTPSPPITPTADGLVAFCRDELERIEALLPRPGRHRARGRAARDRLDAGVPALLRRARCWTRPGPLDHRPEGVLLDHAGPRRVAAGRARVVPARDEHAPAAAAHHPRGRARATTSRARTRTAARRSRGACSGPGCSPRAGRSTSPR